jgi:hypothetical protein
MNPTSNTRYLDILFGFLVLASALLGQLLLWKIPYSFPFGGPDELMHLSMANFIAEHLSWPRWDDPEVVRNAYGISYSAGGSIVYWLHGLSYKLLGHHRLGSWMLLVVYLTLSVWAYRQNKIAGFFVLAGLLPQTLFVFSYVNSDTGTLVTALLLGISVGIFITDRVTVKSFLMLLFFAGLAVTARQHLWAIALLTLIWALLYRHKELFGIDKRFWILAFLIGLLPASWWFVTSLIANDGDILGTFTTAKSMAKFGDPGLPALARAWSDFGLGDFAQSTLVSLYANWGWMSLPLRPVNYLWSGVLIVSIFVVTYRLVDKKIYLFFTLLVAVNFGFMILYSTLYDYQAQGRYLFPGIYIVLGIIAAYMMQKAIHSRLLLGLLVALCLSHAYFSTKLLLTSYVDAFIPKPVLIEKMPEDLHADAALQIDQIQLIDGKLLIRGWSYDRKQSRPFDRVRLILQGDTLLYVAELNREIRPDVATAFHNPALESSGFTAKMIDLKGLAKGTYRCFFEVRLEGTTSVICTDAVFSI